MKVRELRAFNILVSRKVRNIWIGDQPAEPYMPGVRWL